MKFYTIGYGGRDPGEFIGLLNENGVKALVDVRMKPGSAYRSAFSKAKDECKGIQGLLGMEGISYFSFDELGNPFLDEHDWRAKYVERLEREGVKLIQRLIDAQMPGPACLLCCEKKADGCHRASGRVSRQGEGLGASRAHRVSGDTRRADAAGLPASARVGRRRPSPDSQSW